jgi:hypothetical protein
MARAAAEARFLADAVTCDRSHREQSLGTS